MTILMIVLAVVGGAVLSIQAAINGQLGSQVGVFRSAFLTFALGALVTALLIFFFEPKQTLTLMDMPKWQLLGALCGVPYIVIGAGRATYRFSGCYGRRYLWSTGDEHAYR